MAVPPGARPPLACQRSLFDLPPSTAAAAAAAAPAYFDGAGRTPLLLAAYHAGATALAQKLRPWEMPGGDDTTAEVRALFATLIGAGAQGGSCVAITPSTSYALSLVRLSSSSAMAPLKMSTPDCRPLTSPNKPPPWDSVDSKPSPLDIT